MDVKECMCRLYVVVFWLELAEAVKVSTDSTTGSIVLGNRVNELLLFGFTSMI